MGSFLEAFDKGMNLAHMVENDKRLQKAAQQQAQLQKMQMLELAQRLKTIDGKPNPLYNPTDTTAMGRYLRQNPDKTPEQVAAYKRSLTAPKEANTDFAMFVKGYKQSHIDRYLKKNPGATPEQVPEVSPMEISNAWKQRKIEINKQAAIHKGEGFARSRQVKSYDMKTKRFLTHSLWDSQQDPYRFVPASEAKYAVKNVKEMVIALKEDMPTNDIKVMRQSVPSVLQLLEQGRKALEKTKVGPLAGRFKYAMTSKVGLADPAFKKLRVDLSLLATRLMKMHVGAQGSDYIMKHFKEIIEAGKDSRENLIIALDEIEEYAREVGMTHQQQRDKAGLDTQQKGKATHRFIPGQGIVEIK